MRKLVAMAVMVALVAGTLPAVGIAGGAKGPDEKTIARIAAVAPDKARFKPAKPRKMLVLSYQSHNAGRFAGEAALMAFAKKTGAFEPVFVREWPKVVEIMVPEKLKDFDAICLNNSTGGRGKAPNGKTVTENLDEYVKGGGGLCGFHAATDNAMGAVFGGFFTGHPWSQLVGIKVDDPKHPLCEAFGGKGFAVADEIYQFNKGTYTRDKLRVLLSLDMAKTPKRGQRKDQDYAVAWIKDHGKGRVFYGSLGHRPDIFWNPMILRFYLDGIQYALGDVKCDATPSAKLAPAPTPALVPEGVELKPKGKR